MKRLLIIVDPNNDFVDPKGSLYVQHAEKGIDAIIQYIQTQNPEAIILSQDTHNPYHISHRAYWKNDIQPFTTISTKDLQQNKTQPIKANLQMVSEYLNVVESKGQTHTIWPDHCIKDTWGWQFPQRLTDALDHWQKQGDQAKTIQIYEKGEYEDAEMFSIFSFVNSQDIDERGKTIMDEMAKYDEVVICGFAKDYCVAESLKDIRRDDRFKNKLRFLLSGMYAIDNQSPNLAIYQECIDHFGAQNIDD